MGQSLQVMNAFTNYRKVISLADYDWETAEAGKIAGLNVEVSSPNQMVDQFGRKFHHFCTTSYLGLDHHPALLEGAVSALRDIGTLRIANSKNRCKLAALDQYESDLSELFGADCLSHTFLQRSECRNPAIACQWCANAKPPSTSSF